MSAWSHATIGELCDRGEVELQTGPFGSQLHAHEYVDQGVSVVPTEAIRNRQIDQTVLPKITTEKADELRRHRLKPGDILFARRGVQATGHIGFVRANEHDYICGTGAIRLRVLSERFISPAYLSHVLAQPKSIEWFKFHAIGATMPNLNEGIIRQFGFAVPAASEQERIASILDSYDDKIELNRRMSQTLEAIGQAIFKSWFVDFEYSESEGAPADWQEKNLDAAANFLNGLALQKFPPTGDDSLPVIKIAQLRAGHTSGADLAGSNVPPEYVVDTGDVLFSWSGSLEVELWFGGPGALNQHLFKVTSDQYPKWFYYLWTRHHLKEFREIAANKATTMGHIQRKHLSQAKVLVPSPPVMAQLGKALDPIIDMIVAKRVEAGRLAALRDALLPKLLSGELSTAEATNQRSAMIV